MQLEKPKLFPETKSFIVVMLFLLLVIFIRLLFMYHSYQDFISKPFYYTHAKVLNSYNKSKGNRHYQVVKLRSEEGLNFYTTHHVQDNLRHKHLRLQIFPNASITFWDYIGTFYVKSKIKEQVLQTPSFKDDLLQKVSQQHDDTALKSFYNAIFFAAPLEKEIREKVTMLGISHLVALSGFHLGILWGLVYGILLLCYRPLQQRFFPYRHALFDVGLAAMLFLGIYVWFVDFPPSLVRAYAMVLVGWAMVLMGIELLSFTFLTTIMLLLLALFPSLIVSLAFWLSIAGVFYIFLLLQYSKGVTVWIISLMIIPFGIFLLMLPIVHGIFPVTSGYQLLSPLLSLLFVPFYPLAMLVHLIHYGGVFDTMLLNLFNMPQNSTEALLPIWAVCLYIALSVGAIWNKKTFWLVLNLALFYAIYIFSL
jgi:competence protein ComEC